MEHDFTLIKAALGIGIAFGIEMRNFRKRFRFVDYYNE